MPSTKELARLARHRRIRARISGTAARPRLVVSRSLKHIQAQLVDDAAHVVIASASDRVKKGAKLPGTKTERATKVGAAIAELAVSKKITSVVFDRSGNRYHGRVRAVAEAARTGGLQF